jgi:hypothetical protein
MRVMAATSLVAALAWAGCGGGSSAARAERDTTGSGAAMSPPSAESLEVRLEVEPGPEGVLSFRLTVANRGHRTVDLYLHGRQPTFDILVLDGAGSIVWRRLEGEIIPAALTLRPLSGGARLELSARWDRRTNAGTLAGRGEYTARGMLLVEGGALEAPPVRFTIY